MRHTGSKLFIHELISLSKDNFIDKLLNSLESEKDEEAKEDSMH